MFHFRRGERLAYLRKLAPRSRDRRLTRHALWPSAQASQVLPGGSPGQGQFAALGAPVASGEPEEERAVEPTRDLIS